MQIIIFEEEEVKDTSIHSIQKLDFSQKDSLIKDLIGPIPYTTTYMKTLNRIRQNKIQAEFSPSSSQNKVFVGDVPKEKRREP